MPVKIRLQRHGKKGKPYFWIVAADARSKRDGKYLEKLGAYNPNTNPATIELDVDGAVKWLQNGAQPTDTAKAILSYKGALMKNHLAGGVRKGALTEEQAEEKFNAWMEEKVGLVDAKKDTLAKAGADAKAKALKAEKEVNAKREADAKQVIADAEAAEAAANAPAEETETAEVGATTEEVTEEAPAKEENAAEAEAETVTEEVTEEAPVKEEVVAEEAATKNEAETKTEE
ncbi:MAG: 30S ribosomal protein S16 [Aquaticitalea sp.]